MEKENFLGLMEEFIAGIEKTANRTESESSLFCIKKQ
jgi:hypothetical protein